MNMCEQKICSANQKLIFGSAIVLMAKRPERFTKILVDVETLLIALESQR